MTVRWCGGGPCPAGWAQNPSRWVGERYPFRTAGISDIPMAALAEHWRGAATRSPRSGLRACRAAGMGAAALIGGRPHFGFHGAAIQIGLWRAIPWREHYSDLLRSSGDDSARSGAPAVFEQRSRATPKPFQGRRNWPMNLLPACCPWSSPWTPNCSSSVVASPGPAKESPAPVGTASSAETPFPPEVVCSSLGR